ncbi:hypothetical protein BH20ACT15_BH20ACT15_09080 [soil metagenome]
MHGDGRLGAGRERGRGLIELQRHRAPIRFVLIFVALSMGLVAAYILIAPRGFYDDFPAGSSAWVSALPPFNEHLIRDFGSAGLGLGVLAALAAWWMDRRLVQAAAIALFVGSAPHTIYHFTTTEAYSTSDNVASLGGLVLQTLLPLAVLYLASGRSQRPTKEA